MFATLMRPSSPPEMPYEMSVPVLRSASPHVSGGHPRKSSAGLVGGRDHDFVENEKKRPALCAYCGGMIQREERGEWGGGGGGGGNGEGEGGGRRERE